MSSTNFNAIEFNPHGHGTHTGMSGSYYYDFIVLTKVLKQFFFYSGTGFGLFRKIMQI
jgi:hypothetical protein